jgi:iron complex outermembrane receptor protein
MRFRKNLLGGVCAAAVAGFTFVEVAPAFAQLDEIIVYARKKQESLQSVPLSVTAITGAAFEAVNPRTIQDLDGMVAGVFLGKQTASPSSGALYIRGLGYSDVEKTQNPSVGVLVDGVFFGTITGQLMDGFDIESVEINRGPQGVLFGKNTTGGSVSIRRTRPTGEYGVKASAGIGNYKAYEGRVMVNAPIIEDKVALKVGGMTKHRDGFYDNLHTGTDEGAIEYNQATGSLLITPNEDVSVLATFDWIEDRSDIDPTDFTLDGIDDFISIKDFPNRADYDMKRYSLQWDVETPVGTLTTITGYLDTSDTVFQDFDSTPWPAPNPNVAPALQPFLSVNPSTTAGLLHTRRFSTYDQFTQEVRLHNDDIWDGLIDLTAGAFYWWNETTLRQESENYADCGVGAGAFVPLSSAGAGAAFAPTADPLADAISRATVCDDLAAGIDGIQRSAEIVNAYSLFASATINVPNVDGLHMTFGGRYIWEKKSFSTFFEDFQATNALASGSTVFGAPAAAIFPSGTGVTVDLPHADGKWSDFVPKVSIDYQATSDLLVYAYYAQGFRSGGLAIRGTTPTLPGFVYGPEKVDTWEVGFKSQWFDDRLRVNAAGYINTLRGAQANIVLFTPGVFPGTNTIILNAQKTRGTGAEVEIVANPFEGLTILANGSWNHTKSIKSVLPNFAFPTGCPGVVTGGPFPAGTCDASGTVVTARNPEFQFGAQGIYTMPVGPGNLTGNVRALWRDEMTWTNSTPGSFFFAADHEPSYIVMDAGLAYDWEMNGVGMKLSGTVRNFTDERYRTAALAVINFQNSGDPRTYFFELTADF